MSRVLVTRFSSLGDVALLVPAIYSVALKYPQTHFTVMTRKAYAPMFEQISFNVSVIGVDLDRKYKGIWGIIKLVCKVNGFKYTHVADVHDVLRTKVLRSSMIFSFARIAKINKGRDEKSKMIETKETEPFLKHTTQRYLDVFSKLGFDAPMAFKSIYEFRSRSFDYIQKVVPPKEKRWIGLAPFARHQGKIYPLDKVSELIEQLSKLSDVIILLFGGGTHELEIIERLSKKYSDSIIPVKRMKLKNELVLMSYLDVMISMDSANMHLASLSHTPVVSLWGSTHPALGFYGVNQNIANAVQVEQTCRPCSVYGDNPCRFTGQEAYKCMKAIKPEMVVERVRAVLDSE